MKIAIYLHMQNRRLRADRRKVASRLLPGANLSVLGHGAFSTAFAIGRTQVLKVTDNRDLAALWFSNHVRRHSNFHWPRILKQVKGPRHVVTRIERLFPLDAQTERQAKGADSLLSGCKHSSLAELFHFAELKGLNEDFMDCPARLRKQLLACHNEAEMSGFGADNKLTAYMRRLGGALVVADPFLVSD